MLKIIDLLSLNIRISDDESGFNVITGAPCNTETIDEIQSNGLLTKDDDQINSKPDNLIRKTTSCDKQTESNNEPTIHDVTPNCPLVLNNLPTTKSTPAKSLRKAKSFEKTPAEKVDIEIDHDIDSNDKLFEFEECESPLLPLYLLRDEGTVKWVLFNDLGYLLKLKSKDALFKQVSL